MRKFTLYVGDDITEEEPPVEQPPEGRIFVETRLLDDRKKLGTVLAFELAQMIIEIDRPPLIVDIERVEEDR